MKRHNLNITLVVNWWAERELNSHSRHYEYPALPLSYQPVFGASNRSRTDTHWAADFKSAGSTNSPILAILGAPTETRTRKYWFLRPACLPIPPSGHKTWCNLEESNLFQRFFKPPLWPHQLKLLNWCFYQESNLGFARTKGVYCHCTIKAKLTHNLSYYTPCVMEKLNLQVVPPHPSKPFYLYFLQSRGQDRGT